MKKIQILTGVAVLSGFALLSACGGGISVGGVIGNEKDVGYTCSNNQFASGTVSAYNEASAKIRYCIEKVPAAGNPQFYEQRVSCGDASTCVPIK